MSRPLVGPRLRRVLAYLPWLADNPGATLQEIATRFDVRPADLQRDLELLPFVGLPPYTPDRLIDVEIIDECVWVRFADAFGSPLRFTADEGVALLAAGKALLEVPGSDPDGPLATALAKLAATLDAPAAIHVDVDAPDALDVLRDASRELHAVEIEYYSYHRNAASTRVIEPWSVASLLGHWYVRAFCRSAGEERLFRVDRVQRATRLDDSFVPPADVDLVATTVYRANPDAPSVTLDLAPAAAWVLDTYPVMETTAGPDGWTRTTLTVSTPEFLARLLLRLGEDVRVVAPASAVESARDAGRRILERYRGAEAPTGHGTMSDA